MQQIAARAPKEPKRGFRPRGTRQKFVIQAAKKTEKYCKILIRLKAKCPLKRKHKSLTNFCESGINMNILEKSINLYLAVCYE